MPVLLAYGYCNVSVLPVRTEPSHTAEQSTQLLFGERAEIIEVNNRDWARIRCAWDDYVGWCKLSQLTVIQRKEYRQGMRHIVMNKHGKVTAAEGEFLLHPGSELHGLKKGILEIPGGAGKFKGKKMKAGKLELTTEQLKHTATLYLHSPYQWGGRSTSGIDCSGLTQMAYKLCGHAIKRDASEQATEGKLVDFLLNARCGDLAFFEEKEGKINHVGLLLDNETIIHATDTAGRVVIDRIDQQGIISTSLKKRTHHLRMVRRMF